MLGRRCRLLHCQWATMGMSHAQETAAFFCWAVARETRSPAEALLSIPSTKAGKPSPTLLLKLDFSPRAHSIRTSFLFGQALLPPLPPPVKLRIRPTLQCTILERRNGKSSLRLPCSRGCLHFPR